MEDKTSNQELVSIIKNPLKSFGFILGFVLVVGLEIGFFWLIDEIFDMNFRPHGFGWLVMPFIGGVAGASLISSIQKEKIILLFGGYRETRLLVAASASWFLLVTCYILMADPFEGYMSNNDWITVLKWLVFPILLALAVRGLFRWATQSAAEPNAAAVEPATQPNTQANVVKPQEPATTSNFLPRATAITETALKAGEDAQLKDLGDRINQMKAKLEKSGQ